MTTEIQELSEKLSELYGIDAYTVIPIKYRADTDRWIERTRKFYLAEDSGRISDLADDNGIGITFYYGVFDGVKAHKNMQYFSENFVIHPTKHDAARMARVKCLIAI